MEQQKIAKMDRQAMNYLYKIESKRRNIKHAAEDPQAFKDHKEYLDVVDSVLADDKKTSWEPNDPILD